MATATKNVKQAQFRGEVCTWIPWKKGAKPRRWTVLNLTFGQLRQWFFITPYDHNTGRGFQRTQTEAHKKALHRAMCNDEYTPAVFSGGLMRSHENSLKIEKTESGTEVVTITVPENAKLPALDGGHRWGSMEMEWSLAFAAKDEARMKLIEDEKVTIQVYLDSKHLQTDFINLQKGRAMDRNQMKSMQIQNNLVDDEKLPFLKIATDVCHILMKDKSSHLFGQIRFDTNKGGSVSYNSITTLAGSELATSIGGGAKIANWGGKDAEWLASTYVEAFHSIAEFCNREDGEETPDILKNDRMLCPTILGGTRGGSAFMVMLGNMLAFRKVYMDHDEATTEDLELLARTADDLLNKPVGGQSGEDKRREAGAFARNYLAGLDTDYWDGVPALLVRLFSPSTLKVAKTSIPAGALKEELKPLYEVEPVAKAPKTTKAKKNELILENAEA